MINRPTAWFVANVAFFVAADVWAQPQVQLEFRGRRDFKGLDIATQPDPSTPPVVLPATFLTTSVVTDDFDGDGIPEAALALEGRDIISLYHINLATQEYVKYGEISLASGDQPTSIVTARIDGDSFIDLAVANYGSSNTSASTVKLFRGDGLGNFTPMGSALVAGVHPVLIITADFNRDGKTDLAVASAGTQGGAGGSVTTFVQTVLIGGNPQFSRQSFPVSPLLGDKAEGIAAVDLNGDLYPDVAVAGSSSTGASGISFLIWRLNPPPAKFVVGTLAGGGPILSSFGPRPIGVVGVNIPNQTFTSLAIANYGDPNLPSGDPNSVGNVAVLKNLTLTAGLTNNLVFDTAHAQVIHWLTDVPLNDTSAKNPRCLAYRDLDQDGFVDLLVANEGSSNLTMLKKRTGGSDPGFDVVSGNPLYTGNSPRNIAFPPGSPFSRAKVFVANRGSNSFSNFFAIESTENLPFVAAGNVRVDLARPRTVDVANIVPDSGAPILDLVVGSPNDQNPSPGFFWILQGDGAGGFTRRLTYQMDNTGEPSGRYRRPWTVVAKEVEQLPSDPPNAIEIVTANSDGLDVSISSFDPSTSSIIRQRDLAVGIISNDKFIPRGVAVADFDNDGALDIASAGGFWDGSQETNANGFARLVWNMTGGWYSIESTAYTVGPRSNDIVAADLNNDGLLDLAIVNCGTASTPQGPDPGSLSVLLNLGGPHPMFSTLRR
ncbi:MAG: VCBS repeat-containing protein [Planctomycetes bacterium]|nr:VCBS repeat-containing protein [Planctomycetota bacterium]MBI3847203.1 VCBS repeat-containing protein [Planctomycetota bacterium]